MPTEPTDRDPSAIRLPDDVAQRLLARATELDERHGRTSIDQLRRAATEAGISQAAFDTALAELARGELGRPDGAADVPAIGARRRWVTSPFRRGLLVAGAAIASILLGIGIVRGVTERAVPISVDIEAVDVAPDVDLAPSAAPTVVAPPGDGEIDVDRQPETGATPAPSRSPAPTPRAP